MSSSDGSRTNRGGTAIILSKQERDALRTALSLSLAAIAADDPAAIFFTQAAVRLLRRGLQEEAIVDMRSLAQAEGVRLLACADSLMAFGLEPDELIASVELAGAMRFYQIACQSSVSLYI